MRNNLKYFSITIALLSLLTSCSILIPNEQVFDGGEILNDAKMSEIKAEILKGEDDKSNTSQVVDESDASNGSGPDSEETSIVFWTSGGSVWHLFEDCGHLKRGKEILSGTVQDAMDAGKEKVCSTCDKKSQ